MSALHRIFQIFAVLILMHGLAETASACSVCFSAKEETLRAFHLTTALLTFTPFILFGSTALYFRHRLKNTPPGKDSSNR